MKIGAIPIPVSAEFYKQLAAALPSSCRCAKCGFTQTVDPAHCIQIGWPRCCGQTMILGAPGSRPPKLKRFDAAPTTGSGTDFANPHE